MYGQIRHAVILRQYIHKKIAGIGSSAVIGSGFGDKLNLQPIEQSILQAHDYTPSASELLLRFAFNLSYSCLPRSSSIMKTATAMHWRIGSLSN